MVIVWDVYVINLQKKIGNFKKEDVVTTDHIIIGDKVFSIYNRVMQWYYNLAHDN